VVVVAQPITLRAVRVVRAAVVLLVVLVQPIKVLLVQVAVAHKAQVVVVLVLVEHQLLTEVLEFHLL
jgi:hypothetical protein